MIEGIPVTGLIIDIILFFIIAGNAILGFKKGLVGVIFSICSTIIAIILVLILYKPTTNYIINNTELSKKLENVLETKLQGLFETSSTEMIETPQLDDSKSGILKVFIGKEINKILNDTAGNIIKNISVEISHKIISVIVFFALFVIIRLVLYVFKNYVELVANLPFIRIINKSGGMVYGIVKGFLLIYLVLAILSVVLTVTGNTVMIASIEKAPICSKMFSNNLILNLIFKFV